MALAGWAAKKVYIPVRDTDTRKMRLKKVLRDIFLFCYLNDILKGGVN